MNILLLLAHEIAEYDDLRMLTDLGADVFSIGAYSNPGNPGRALRPALPNVRHHADLESLCHEQRVKHEGQSTEFGIVDWAKADLHPGVIEWADTIICHHYLESWVLAQWDRIKHKRVIWRTCGQSNPRLEMEMLQLRDEGLQIIRYSPAERRGFEPLGCWAGQDALIRFGKYPDDYGPWSGDDIAVGNVTQNLVARGEHCGYPFWLDATKDLPTHPAGTGSELMPNGTGELTYDEMREYLRHIRTYLYMGTQPASYTLALMEAMLSGVPVISMGPRDLWMPALFEGHELVTGYDDPRQAAAMLRFLLDSPKRAAELGEGQRQEAISLFGIAMIAPQWAAFLGL